MTTITPEIEHVFSELAPDIRRQRRSALLRPLNYSLIVIGVAGLLVMIANGGTAPGYIIIGSTLVLGLFVAWLERIGQSALAANLFSLWVNIGTLLLAAINLFVDRQLGSAALFACELSLSVMLAGMLLGGRAAFLFAIINSIAVFALFERYFAGPGAVAGTSALSSTLSAVIPIIFFLLLVAVITWLYQRALDISDVRLSAARRQIMQDELLRRDLAVARELQQRLYPPPPLTDSCLQIASRSVPARETSGDFYDYIDLDDGLLGIVVADVTGKSIAAALMMALARSTLRSVAQRHSSPVEVLSYANEIICRDHSAHQMITVFYGILDTNNLTLRFSNAGHPYPLLRRGNGLDEFEIGGLPLGAMPNALYVERTIQMEPGDQLYILSDGFIEERNAKRELFGYDRLSGTILGANPLDPEAALEHLWRALGSFRGATEQNDDITLVVVQATHTNRGHGR
jgi:serine phosphatase RsbU (regulator of sigma subunit)